MLQTPCWWFLAVAKRIHEGTLATTMKPLASIREALQGFALQLLEPNCLHQNLGERTRELAGLQGCASQERSMSADSNTTLESDILV